MQEGWTLGVRGWKKNRVGLYLVKEAAHCCIRTSAVDRGGVIGRLKWSRIRVVRCLSAQPYFVLLL